MSAGGPVVLWFTGDPRAAGQGTSPVVALTGTTVEVADPGALVDLLPPGVPVASWVRRGDGLVGWGEVARFTARGPGRFAAARRWWSSTFAASRVRDAVRTPGTGLVAMCSFAFADDSAGDSVLVVPAVIVGRRAGRCWVTRVTRTADADPGTGGAPDPTDDAVAVRPRPLPVAPGEVAWSDGVLAAPAWEDAVAEAVARIDQRRVEKVVLARDLVGTTAEPLDVRWPLRSLAATYLPCWTFAVDGLFGATPELLLRSDRGLVTSRVLAGTIWRTGDPGTDAAVLARTLAHSGKDLAEHRLAVASAAEVLSRHCSSINLPDEPFVLHLPNVLHLATDVTGALASRSALLDLVADLHPTAAVGGTPTDAAVALIPELERMDRGRYAGPVGWVDAGGDGEFGIALRCAQLDPDDPHTVRAFAGCGIVAGSDPVTELAETVAKLVPVRDALSG